MKKSIGKKNPSIKQYFLIPRIYCFEKIAFKVSHLNILYLYTIIKNIFKTIHWIN